MVSCLLYMWLLETRLTKVIQIRVCVIVYQLSYKSVFVFQESVDSRINNVLVGSLHSLTYFSFSKNKSLHYTTICHC